MRISLIATFLALRKTSVDEKTEHTDRAALQSLLQSVADSGANGAAVRHEPKRVAAKGAPAAFESLAAAACVQRPGHGPDQTVHPAG